MKAWLSITGGGLLGLSLTLAGATEPPLLRCQSGPSSSRKLKLTLNLADGDVRFNLDGNLFVFSPESTSLQKLKDQETGGEKLTWSSAPYSWNLEVTSSDLRLASGIFQSRTSSIAIRCAYPNPEIQAAWSRHFHKFVCQGETDLAQLLLESTRSFDINWKNPATNETALDCAKRLGNQPLQSLLMRSQEFGRETATPAISFPVQAQPQQVATVVYDAPIGPLPMDTQASTPPAPSPEVRGPFEFPEINLAVQDAQTRFFTRDLKGPNEAGRGWTLTQASNHWPTLSAQTGSTAIPLISGNSALLLARIRETQLEPETGIVLGKVPRGWDVVLSGRSEKPTYFETDGQIAKAEATDHERYFNFMNTAPGTQTLQLIGMNAISGGMVTLPVRSATATYIDLATLSYESVSGTVLDAASSTRAPLKAARVQLMGQPGTAVWTDQLGNFEIKQVLVSEAVPIQIDIQAAVKDENTRAHRFSLYRDQLAARDYYLFSERDLKDWEETLQGSLNSENGVVIGAAPGFIRSTYRAFASLNPFQGLTPNVYSLAPSGQMIERAPLDAEQPRFYSMDVPEGPTVVQILDELGKSHASQLIFSTPRTVNILRFDAP